MKLTQQQQQQQQQKTDKESVDERSVFKRSSRVLRSPPRSTPQSSKKAKEVPEERPSKTVMETQSETPKQPTQCATPTQTGLQCFYSSPKQEFIQKMRAAEEESLRKCKRAINKMKLALLKQKNVSMDIKDGVSELEEMLDVIGSYRRNWVMAETEAKLNASKRVTEAIRATVVATPNTFQAKRVATSPPAPSTRLQRTGINGENGEWQIVGEKRRRIRSGTEAGPKTGPKPANAGQVKKPVKSKVQSEALLIKPTEGHSYADVLRDLRSKIKPGDTEAKIKAVRKTRAGAILVELDKGEKIKPTFCEALKTTLQGSAVITDLKPKTTVEIRDLDSLTTKEEVVEALKTAITITTEEIGVNLSAPNNREQIRAYVTLTQEKADMLLDKSRIKIGWVNCRMRPQLSIKRCFKCFGPGHLTWNC